MKSFLISITFLCIFISATAVNCIFVTDILGRTDLVLSELADMTDESDSADFADACNELLRFWLSEKPFLSLSINDSDLTQCTVSLEYLCVHSRSSNRADRNAALCEAQTRIRAILRRERFSFYNLF